MDPISVMDMALVYLRTTSLERLGRAHLLYHMREQVGAGVVIELGWVGGSGCERVPYGACTLSQVWQK